jgi:hypothetical protein
MLVFGCRNMKKKNQMEHIDIGMLHIPRDYLLFDKETKEIVCDRIIDSLLHHLDRELPLEVNRIDYLIGIIESSIITNVEDENYEMCQIMEDCKTRLNEA